MSSFLKKIKNKVRTSEKFQKTIKKSIPTDTVKGAKIAKSTKSKATPNKEGNKSRVTVSFGDQRCFGNTFICNQFASALFWKQSA